jgi:hypothetical protein
MIQKISDDVLWSQLVARAWCDDAIMKRLVSNPRDVLVEHGVDVPESTEVTVAEGDEVKIEGDVETALCFTLPFSPPFELADEDLAGGRVYAQCFCGACAACAACARCACRCACRCF